MKEEIFIVIRSANERSLPLAIEAVKKQTPYFIIIEEYPFRNALKKMFSISKEISYPYLLALDADVILYPDALQKITSAIDTHLKQFSKLFFLDFFVIDKFRGKCCSGCHLYLNKYSKLLLDHVLENVDETRPENHLILDFAKTHQLTFKSTEILVGMHDYEQYYKDLYAKYFRRAKRRSHEAKLLLNVIQKRKIYALKEDFDFDVVLKGLQDGMSAQDAPHFNAKAYIKIEDLMPLNEKPAILPLK